jgi:starch phosphorylase
VFLFGSTSEQVACSRGWYDARWHDEYVDETRLALDLVFPGPVNRREPDLFAPIPDALLSHGDHDMHLTDSSPCTLAQSRSCELHANRQAWGYKTILDVSPSGKFSRTARMRSTLS